jgi:uncharacterized protein (TIGR02001 family)
MNIIRNAAIALAATVAFSSSATAADDIATQEEIASAFDVTFGVAVTSRYMSRGNAVSDGPALQGYIEPSYGMFYAGAWFSTIGGDADDDVEVDLYLGVRPEFGNLSLDFGYAHYLYDESEDSGELYAKASYPFTDFFSAGGELYYDHVYETTYGAASVEIGLPYDFTLSAAIGTYFDDDTDPVDWNVGVSYTFNDLVTIDGRYHDSNFDHGRFVASISLDTSWSALRRK